MKNIVQLVLFSAIMNLANAQEKKETIIYVDGVETKNVEYQFKDYFILDHYIEGKLKSSTRTKDNITITGSLEYFKQYGKYIEINIIVTNNSSDTFNFFPSSHLEAYVEDSKGKRNNFLTFEEYDKIVKRRQIGTAVLMGLTTGVANAGAGSVYGSSYGNIGGVGYSSTYYGYSPSLARVEQELNNQRLTSFLNTQADLYLLARNQYFKKNTILPGQTIVGHLLIPIKRLKDGIIKAKANIILNDIEFNFSKKFLF